MLYIAQWQGTGTRQDPYRPVGIEKFDGLAWGALDLRPDHTSAPLDGYCLLYVPASARTVSGLVKLGDDPDDTFTATVRTVMRNRLQLGVDDDDSLVGSPRKLLERLMFMPGRKWKPVMCDRQGRKFVHIGGKQFATAKIAPPKADELVDPTDTFTRADENPATGWTQTGSALRVIGNRLANGSGGGNDAIGYYTAYTPAADHYSEFTYSTLSNGDASPMVRMAAANPSGYALNGYTGSPQLYKVDAGGGFTSIAGGLTGFGGVHDGSVLRCSIVGSSISGTVDGVAIGGGLPHTDTSYATGRAGLHIYDGLVRLSQWTGADIGGSGATLDGEAAVTNVAGDDGTLSAGAVALVATAAATQAVTPAGALSDGSILTPGLVQALLANSTRTSQVTGKVVAQLMNPSLGDNCLLLAMAWSTASGAPVLNVTDDQLNVWEQVVTQANGGGSFNVTVWMAKGAAADTRVVTVNVTGGVIHYAQPACCEFYGIDVFDPIDDVVSVSGNDSAWSPGTLTTTADKALIIAIGVDSAGFIPYGNFVADADSDLLNADRMNGFAWQYGIKDVAGNVTPIITASQFKPFIGIGIALKASSHGTQPTAPARIRRATWVEVSGPSTTDYVQQAPTEGNIIAVGWIGASGAATDPAEVRSMTAISDTAGNAYNRTVGVGGGTSGFAQWGYVEEAIAALDNVVTITTQADNLSTAVIFDIVAPGFVFDKSADAEGFQGDAGDLNTVSITPSNPNGLVLGLVGINNGACDEMLGAGYLGDNPYTSDEDGGGNVFHQDNGWGHVFNATTDPLTFGWKTSNVGLGDGVQDWAAQAIAFSPPSNTPLDGETAITALSADDGVLSAGALALPAIDSSVTTPVGDVGALAVGALALPAGTAVTTLTADDAVLQSEGLLVGGTAITTTAGDDATLAGGALALPVTGPSITNVVTQDGGLTPGGLALAATPAVTSLAADQGNLTAGPLALVGTAGVTSTGSDEVPPLQAPTLFGDSSIAEAVTPDATLTVGAVALLADPAVSSAFGLDGVLSATGGIMLLATGPSVATLVGPGATLFPGLIQRQPLQPLIKVSQFFDEVKVQLDTLNLAQLTGALHRVRKVEEDVSQPEGRQDGPWGRVVIVPTLNVWGQNPQPAQIRTVSFLVRIEFNRYNSPGYDVSYILEAAHALCLAQLEGFAPALRQAQVMIPVYLNTAPSPSPLWDDSRQLWFSSAEYRCELMVKVNP